MYKLNEYIVYGATGVCQIEDIRYEKLGSHDDKKYYVLKPLSSPNSTLYVPVDNEELTMKMRYVITNDEIHTMIDKMPNLQELWIEDDRFRNEKFNEIIKNGDLSELVKLIKSIYVRKNELMEGGKKLHKGDEKAMETAEALLCEEFAFVLGIEPEEVIPFIIDRAEEVH